MAAPRQMTAETLNALKGWGTNLHAVDYECKLDPTVTTRVPPGSVVYVDPTSCKLKLGLEANRYMPMFTFHASDDPDITNEYPKNADTAYTVGNSPITGNPVAAKGGWVPISPTGVMLSLVAVGAYELVSTNYFLGAGQTFAPQDALTSPLTANAVVSGSAAGQLVKGTWGTHSICGLVSRAVNSDGTTDNGYGSKAVAFWPVFLPKI